jgi:putative ABC transport system permease protein
LSPLTFGQATIAYGSRNREVPVLGTTPEVLDLHRLSVVRGSFLPQGEHSRGTNVCVIGTKIQQELFGQANPLGQILRIGDWRFRVIGVMAPKGEHMGFNFDDVVMIPVATAMRLFNQTSLFRIFIEATSYGDLNKVKEQTLAILTERHREEDVTILTQDSILAAFNEIFTALTLALAGIAAISLTVAGIGIMNVMLVSVSERTSEIGLLKALGVTHGQILAVFLAEASLLSMIGGIVGLAAAQLLINVSLEIFPSFQPEIPRWAVVMAVAVAIGVGLLFGVWPARRASKLDPILALSRR